MPTHLHARLIEFSVTLCLLQDCWKKVIINIATYHVPSTSVCSPPRVTALLPPLLPSPGPVRDNALSSVRAHRVGPMPLQCPLPPSVHTVLSVLGHQVDVCRICLIEPRLTHLCLFIFITGFLLCRLVLRGMRRKSVELLGLEIKQYCRENAYHF